MLPHRLCAAMCLLLATGTTVHADDKGDKVCEVETKKDIAYYDGKDADDAKHKLDLYLPKGQKDFPILFFIHGGAWVSGDRNYFGIYSAVGRHFASQGIGTVVISYRLSPGVQHPEHIKDVARAFAWTHKNIKDYGGRPDRIFVSGHSAGGHLSALLATDESHLKAHKLDLSAIRGAAPLSGIYKIEDNKWFHPVFGKDVKLQKEASPIVHARPGLPDFLIVHADKDLEVCSSKGCKAFCDALTDQKVDAKVVEIKDRNHVDLLLKMSQKDDPCEKALREFIAARMK